MLLTSQLLEPSVTCVQDALQGVQHHFQGSQDHLQGVQEDVSVPQWNPGLLNMTVKRLEQPGLTLALRELEEKRT